MRYPPTDCQTERREEFAGVTEPGCADGLRADTDSAARSERICCVTHWLYQVRSGTLQINFLSRYFWTPASNQVDKEHLWL